MTATQVQKYSKLPLSKLKIKAQKVFNAWIRERDKDKPCISCGKGRVENAGHYLSQGHHSALRFDEKNTNGQCIRCNLYLSGNLINAQNLEDCGFNISYQIIWNKEQGVIGRGDYHFKHEPCWYAVREKKKHNWQGSRKETTVWDINKANKKDTGHSTQKPIECMARPIRNNTFERESVYDPFLGSGTTLIAADQLNRACYGQEIDPAYCDIIVARYIKFKQSQSAETGISIRRNGKELSPKDIQKYLAQIEKKDETDK